MDEQPKKKKNLNAKQKIFVGKLVEGATQKDAYLAAYGNVKNPNTSASILAKLPHVQESIQELLERKHPDLKENIGSVLNEIILNPEQRTSDRLAAIKLVGEYFGWKAPTRTQNLHAKVDVSKFKLPGQE